MHFFAQVKERPLQDGSLTLLLPFTSATNGTEIIEVEVKIQTEVNTEIETDRDRAGRDRDRDSFLANIQRGKVARL